MRKPVSIIWRNPLPLLAALVAMAAVGCNRQDMRDQSRYEPLEASRFFKDGLSARPLIENTIARGELRLDTHMFEGKIDGNYAETLPMPLTREVLDRGQIRFGIYCTPCHDAVGTGQGMVVQRGYPQPRSYHDADLRAKPIGYYFEVMTKGFGRMPDYAAQVKPADRWAIAAYIRALQLSQAAHINDLPAEDQDLIKGAVAKAPEKQDALGAQEHHQ